MESSAVKLQSVAGGAMATAEQTYLRAELLGRREHILSMEPGTDGARSAKQLLGEIDTALARMEAGAFGVCLSCHTPVEAERLLQDPTVEVCLDCLSPAEQRALERDLTLAAQIQRGLLPRRDLAPLGWRVRYHYQPAALVSGDFCDLLETDSGLLFLFGDVAGKGVAASMLMSHLHATFRALADTEQSVERMATLANRLFCESTLAGQYATLVVGRGAKDGSVEFVSAGHLPVLHVRSGGAMSREATGYPLGMFCKAEFALHRMSLLPGESLLLYTDGVSEARNSADEEYGLERVLEVASRCASLSPEELIENCLSEVSRFSGARKATDDLTLLALQHVQ
jgi:sigma-B regulation protein RsbU (phosphoserine phosphatase)